MTVLESRVVQWSRATDEKMNKRKQTFGPCNYICGLGG